MSLSILREKFWEMPLNELSRLEWESLCDGCGRCCLKKVIDDDTEELFWIRIVCRYFDSGSGKCKYYKERTKIVSDCIDVREVVSKSVDWMPATCAYRLRANNKPLFDWHPLLSENSASVVDSGVSILNRCISEDNVHPKEYFEHIIRWVDS